MNRSMKALLPSIVVLSSMTAMGAQAGRQDFFFAEETSRLPRDTTLPGTSSTDVDLVDVDSDGDLDLFVAEGTDGIAGRPNRLLLNDGRGLFTDVSALHLPADGANSTKADFGDVDGDGDLDAIVANLGPEQLLINDGKGVFADASTGLPLPPPLLEDISADARLADVDGDGDLDILVSNENPLTPVRLAAPKIGCLSTTARACLPMKRWRDCRGPRIRPAPCFPATSMAMVISMLS